MIGLLPRVLCFTLLSLVTVTAYAAPAATSDDQRGASPAIRLWNGDAPGALGKKPGDIPELTPFLPPEGKANGTAVIVCPGGGYRHLAMMHEGYDVARWLNTLGVTAFVLKYRLNSDGYAHPAPLQDVSRAVRLVRSDAQRWHLDPHRIGVLGFSAGGHLASTIGTHHDQGQAQSADKIERASSRPDFLVLCYPVISLEAFTHSSSRSALLGKNPSVEQLRLLSNDQQVRADTPTTFLFHTATDKAVPVENSLMFFTALRRAGVPAELHVFQEGVHGVGLGKGDPALTKWPLLCEQWLAKNKLLPPHTQAK